MSRQNSYDFLPFWIRIRRSKTILTAICVVIYVVICAVICALHCSVIGRRTHSLHVPRIVTAIKQTVFISCAINVEHASSIVVILINSCRSARGTHSQMLAYNRSVIIFPVVWTNRWQYSGLTIDGKQSTSGSQIYSILCCNIRKKSLFFEYCIWSIWTLWEWCFQLKQPKAIVHRTW
jgi:hypothetical protein